MTLSIRKKIRIYYSLSERFFMSRDLRHYARQTNTRLIIGGILLLFIVGDGLIYLFYGRNAALMGIVCLLFGLSPLVLIWGALAGLEWIVKRADKS